MKLVIGLGNPEEKFVNNRHNVGHMFVDAAADKLSNTEVKILKTDTFMNESGKFVRKWTDFYKVAPEDLYIVHDDLDMRIGQYKIQLGIGPKVHYGVNSVEEALSDKNFWRIRIGVDDRDVNSRTPGEEYVLQDFTTEEKKVLEDIFPKIWEELHELKIKN